VFFRNLFSPGEKERGIHSNRNSHLVVCKEQKTCIVTGLFATEAPIFHKVFHGAVENFNPWKLSSDRRRWNFKQLHRSGRTEACMVPFCE
jgi:hypothetical protein